MDGVLVESRGISGNDKALMYALGGIARGGATRGGYIPFLPQIAVDGAPGAWRVLIASLSIQDRLNEAPNTCTFTIQGARPRDGASIVITLGSINNLNRLFAGTVIRSTQVYLADNPAHVAFQVEGIDWTWQVNATLVAARYRSQSATLIGRDLVARFAPGFTAQIPDGLPAVDEISFDHPPVMDAFAQLAARIGGYAKTDYNKQIWLWTTPPPGGPLPPTPITPDHPSLRDVTYARDLSQVVTRAYVEGGGVNTLGLVAAGETRIPVEDAAWYSATGGRVTSGPQKLYYSGIVAAGAGALASAVGGATGNVAPTAAPTIGSTPGAGLPLGTYKYSYTWQTVAGETLPSPLAPFVGSGVGPVTPPSGVAQAGTELGVGAYKYAFAWVTVEGPAYGETVPTAASASVTTTSTEIAPPSGAPIPTVQAGPGLAPGYYRYLHTFVTGVGETTRGPESGAVSVPTPPGTPGAPSVSQFIGGKLTPGATYGLASVWSADEGTPPIYISNVSARTIITMTAGSTDAGGSQPTSNRAFGRVWALRTKANDPNGTLYYTFSATDNASSAFLYFGKHTDAELTQALGAQGTWAAARVAVSGIAVGPSGVTQRKIYRTAANGVSYGLVATIANNTETALVAPDTAGNIGAAPPSTNTTAQAARRIAVSGIAVGPSGTVGRNLYRTDVNGSALKHLVFINNNSATTYVDALPDSALTRPPVDTGNASLAQATVSNVLVGPANVTARKIYRTAVNGSALKLLTTIANNTGTTMPGADTTADASLGAAAPTTDTSGLTSGPVGGQVNAGSTEIPVANTAPFAPEGWALAGGQLLRYRGTTATHITGLPATGVGSLGISIPYNTVIEVAAQLTGIPPYGGGHIQYDLADGQPVNVLGRADDAAAQQALAAVVGGTGVIESYQQDGRLSNTEALARARAVLDLRSLVRETLRYRCRDPRTVSGVEVSVNLPQWSLVTTLQIQDVTISQFSGTGQHYPVFDVVASSTRFSFEDLIRQRRGL